jgi:hypothetical protein
VAEHRWGPPIKGSLDGQPFTFPGRCNDCGREWSRLAGQCPRPNDPGTHVFRFGLDTCSGCGLRSDQVDGPCRDWREYVFEGGPLDDEPSFDPREPLDADYIREAFERLMDEIEDRRRARYARYARASRSFRPAEVDEAELKRLYRQAAMKHHPDRGGDVATMARINDAYDRKDASALAALAG